MSRKVTTEEKSAIIRVRRSVFIILIENVTISGTTYSFLRYCLIQLSNKQLKYMNYLLSLSISTQWIRSFLSCFSLISSHFFLIDLSHQIWLTCYQTIIHNVLFDEYFAPFQQFISEFNFVQVCCLVQKVDIQFNLIPASLLAMCMCVMLEGINRKKERKGIIRQ